jgi:DNA-binding transcriptional regulator WhiA
MAMTASVKDELSRLSVTKPCCRKAEVSAILRFAGGLHISAGKILIEVELDTAQTSRRLRKDIAEIFGHDSELAVLSPSGLRKGSRYVVRITSDSEALARQTGSSALEITCPGPEAALALVGAARRLGISAKAREVRAVDRVVIRDGDAIGALLTRLGAHESVLAWEERRMRREVRATANRLANFDDANLRRSARAAVAASARVARAMEILGEEIPEHLKEAGELRITHGQASLEELGSLASPPMTKDAIAGRIRRLLAMADKRAHDLGIPDTEAGLSPDLLAD